MCVYVCVNEKVLISPFFKKSEVNTLYDFLRKVKGCCQSTYVTYKFVT